MNRFPTINYFYTTQESPGRSVAQYSNSNGNAPGGPPPSNYPSQPSGQGGGGAHPHSFYQNGNYSSISPSSPPHSTWEQQTSVQNFGNSGGYGGYQHQQPQHDSYQGQELQARFPNMGYVARQQQYCVPNMAHQYSMIQQQNQLQGQQPPTPTQFEQQNMVEHYHPYQRSIHPQIQEQPRRTTGFLEQLLENKSPSRATYPYRQGAPRGVAMMGTTPSSGMTSNFPTGYGSVARPNSSRPRCRSAFVVAGSQPQSHLDPSSNPVMNRNVPVNLTMNGNNGVNMPSVNKEGGMLRELLKSKADERFKRNTGLFEDIVDEKIVEMNPSVVTTQRLRNLKTQVSLLSGELNKQEQDVNKTKETCDKKLEEFKASNQAYTSTYDKLCKPISQETYRDLIDKYYYEIKDNGTDAGTNCDCSDDQETSELKPTNTEKVNLDKRASPITPPPSNGDDDDSSSDLMIIGEIKKEKPKLSFNLMSEGWGSFQPYPEQGYTNQNPGFSRAPLQMTGSAPSQPPPHFGYNYKSQLYTDKMQMSDPLGNAPSPAHCGTGEFQSLEGRSQYYDGGNYNYEPVTPPPQFLDGSSSSQEMGYENFENRPPYSMPRLIPDGGGGGSVKTHPPSWSSYPSPPRNYLQKGFGEMLEQQQHQHPETQPVKDLRERPSEELRNFLIKLVKQKCGEGWGASQKSPDGGEVDKPMTRSNGLFCGGGIMEVKRESQPPPAAASMTLPLQLPPCDWLRDDLLHDDSSKQEQKQKKVNAEEPKSTNPDLISLIDDDDDDEGRLIIAEADEENTDKERQIEIPEVEIGAASGSSSKLTELLDKPLALGSRNDLKKVEIALDSENKLQISDNVTVEGIGENPENMPFGIAHRITGDNNEEGG